MINYIESIDIKTLKDCITDTVLFDDENERARQRIFRLFLDSGYSKEELKPRMIVRFPEKRGLSVIDLTVSVEGKCCMILRYGLSSIVTRHRAALAAARIYTGKQIPYVVVTNGNDADILDGKSGKVLNSGLSNIPSKEMLMEISSNSFPKVSEKQLEVERRILLLYDVV